MSRLRVVELTSVAQLRAAASPWDALWQRSEVTNPTARAEMVAQWVERFAPSNRLRVLVVEDQNNWLGALPLVRDPGSRLPLGGMTANVWSSNGDLVLEPESDVAAVLDAMATALRRSPWPLVCLEGIPLEMPRWAGFREALERCGVANELDEREPVGLVRLAPDWQTFQRRLDKRDCQKMARCGRRLAERGEIEVQWLTDLSPGDVEHYLRIALDIEDRGWKGRAGSSILRWPGMHEFFARQARQLAAWGQLELAILSCGGRPISFVYGYVGKGVSHWHKIGYLTEQGCCSPGQFLQWELLQRLHRQPGRVAVDTLGPLTRALAMWNPTPCRTGRLLVCGRPAGRAVLAAARHYRAIRRTCSSWGRRDHRASDRGHSANCQADRGVAGAKSRPRPLARRGRYRPGDLVEVLSEAEIRGTLDGRGGLDGLPFMPGMARYCGRQFRVFRRVEKIFLDRRYEVRRMRGAVLLEGLRCRGDAQNDCQMGCMLIWKESWLKPAAKAPPAPLVPPGAGRPALPQLSIVERERYCCQATELAGATTPLPWWDVGQYLRDLRDARVSPSEMARMLAVLVKTKLRRVLGIPEKASAKGPWTKTPTEHLGLQPGDLVEVKSREEIEGTLDGEGRNRGLSFGGDMIDYCSRRYRVARRVEKLVVEWTGQMRSLQDTVALEGVTCTALERRACPRDCYHLWREIWLRKVEDGAVLSPRPSGIPLVDQPDSCGLGPAAQPVCSCQQAGG